MNDSLPGTSGRRRIYLMRHGEVAYFDADGRPVHPKFVDLTEDGQAQARAMAQMLADVPFDRAICSGLPRTQQTANLVLEGRGIELEEDADLKEIKSGANRGRTPEQVEAEFTYGMEGAASPGARFAGGDRYADFYHRVTGAFHRILLSPGWRNLLIVAHEGTNRMILGWTSGGGLHSVKAFEQDPCCLNIIDADVIDGRLERCFIKLMNATPINHPKVGNHLTSMEQVWDLRRRILQRAK
jgi:broad specificity phosphatase PhoE